MKQKEVDAIVLEIFNICREKKLKFEYKNYIISDSLCESIEISKWCDTLNKTLFSLTSYITVEHNLFGYIDEYTINIQDALEQVKQYKK